MSTAVFCGSFDPFTTGHFNVARRAADLFGSVTVLVAANSEKKCLFTDEERLAIARDSCAEDARICVQLCSETIADAARRLGAVAIVKGLRDSTDYNYESHFAGAMRALGAPEVVFLDVEPAFAHVSSTFVRELFRYGKDYRPYLCRGAHVLVENYLAKKGEK
ncbi:MAG: pantetheine-phosphate adenylyltransferase [Clostridia bacterium]|nr:pantetheine-phosphate adenylyltransferase [Clostridia bacterium]